MNSSNSFDRSPTNDDCHTLSAQHLDRIQDMPCPPQPLTRYETGLSVDTIRPSRRNSGESTARPAVSSSATTPDQQYTEVNLNTSTSEVMNLDAERHLTNDDEKISQSAQEAGEASLTLIRMRYSHLFTNMAQGDLDIENQIKQLLTKAWHLGEVADRTADPILGGHILARAESETARAWAQFNEQLSELQKQHDELEQQRREQEAREAAQEAERSRRALRELQSSEGFRDSGLITLGGARTRAQRRQSRGNSHRGNGLTSND